ncbi:putative transmembrane protein [Toxoplasma gondii CAST]|uniref:Putative transmembrane protein n=1 Tax=Toxoplasma gondii CAST TaxID=943122 RepID=A0A425I851_TOXGO|nr:putative transmembrane protein [Toxoplasma gondii CAST]
MLDLLGGPDSALLVVNSSPQEAERFLRLSVKEKDKGNPPRCRQLQSRALARLRRSLEHADVVLASSLITRRLGKRRETAARVETVSPSGSGEGFVNCDEESPDRDERHRFTHFVLICKPTDEERETESEMPEEEKRKFAGRVEEEDERTVKPNGDSEMRGVVDGKQAVCGGGRAQKRRGRAEKKSDPHGEETCMSLSPSCTQEAVDTDAGAGKEPSERESRKEDAGEKGKKPAASTVLPFLLPHSRDELISRKENVTAAADASPHLQDRREREALHREETKGRQAERDEEERREDEREEERGASRNVLREGIPSVVISCSSSSSTAATTPCQQLHRVHAFPRSPRRRETSDAREEEQDFQQEERRDTDRMREGNKETVSGERETLGGRKTDSEDFGEFEREGASLSMTGENDAKTEASCCVTVSPCTRGSHAKAREEGEEETLETPRVLRRIWCVPPLCCFAARSEKREFRAKDLRLSFLCLLPYTFLSCAVTVFSALIPSTLFLVRSADSPCSASDEETACIFASSATLSGAGASAGERHSVSTWTTSKTLEVAVQETLQQAAVCAVMLAMWGIGVVYFATRSFLRGFNLGLKFLCIKVLVVVIQVSEIVAKFRGSPTFDADVATLSPLPHGVEGAGFLELHHSVFDFVLILLALPVTVLALRTFDPRELHRLEDRSPAFGGVSPALSHQLLALEGKRGETKGETTERRRREQGERTGSGPRERLEETKGTRIRDRETRERRRTEQGERAERRQKEEMEERATRD